MQNNLNPSEKPLLASCDVSEPNCSTSQGVAPTWGRVSWQDGTSPWQQGRLWSAPPEPRQRHSNQGHSQALESLLVVFLLLGWQEQRTITAFLVQLTNYMLAQFSLSTISQSKSNQNSKTGLCFLKFINPLCLLHLYRLLLLSHVLNQRKEHEF